jgi:hypothetical protein
VTSTKNTYTCGYSRSDVRKAPFLSPHSRHQRNSEKVMCNHAVRGGKGSTQPQCGTQTAAPENVSPKRRRRRGGIQVTRAVHSPPPKAADRRLQSMFLGGCAFSVSFDPVVWVEGGNGPSTPVKLNDVGGKRQVEKHTRSCCRSLSADEKCHLYKRRHDLMPVSRNRAWVRSILELNCMIGT